MMTNIAFTLLQAAAIDPAYIRFSWSTNTDRKHEQRYQGRTQDFLRGGRFFSMYNGQ